MQTIKGSCEIFAGVRLMTPDEIYEIDPIYYNGDEELWILESDEQTKQRLIAGMAPLGIVCEPDDIAITNLDIENGTKYCSGNWKYTSQNKEDEQYFKKNSSMDLYIKGMAGFASWTNQVEVWIRKNDDL